MRHIKLDVLVHIIWDTSPTPYLVHVFLVIFVLVWLAEICLRVVPHSGVVSPGPYDLWTLSCTFGVTFQVLQLHFVVDVYLAWCFPLFVGHVGECNADIVWFYLLITFVYNTSLLLVAVKCRLVLDSQVSHRLHGVSSYIWLLNANSQERLNFYLPLWVLLRETGFNPLN